MAFKDFQTFKNFFTRELRNLDVRRDTFARVMDRTGGEMGWPGPTLSRRELNHLHSLYLDALSCAIRHSLPKAASLTDVSWSTETNRAAGCRALG